MRKRITLLAPRRIQRKAALRRLVKSVLDAKGCSKRVNIVLTDDETLRDLNERFKGRKGPTDVLAFDFEEPDFLGEVYVSLDRAREQARYYGVSEEEEIERLVLHGLLHLLGYTHPRMKPIMKRYLG
ncbi:rRNA maturation RNase YbeY [candidate division WOR-3 bacterium]|nr:rRNA maturation RNase YbeY [candidate division WOR-3 bacterium]MCK4334323.1 rRNA maturation RNase YbeY [candidate division WOR-3 bacterium]